MSTRNITLTARLDRFVKEQVESGKYKDAGEVLRAGLRLLEQQSQIEEQKLALLKQLATESFETLDQGRGLALDDERQLIDAIGRIGRRAARSNHVPPLE